MTGKNRRGQIGLVDDAASSDVHDAHAWLALGERFSVEQVGRFFGLGQVNRDEVGARQQVIETHFLNAHVTSTLISDVGVVGHEVHTKRHGSLRHQGANLAQTNNTEGLAVEFDALPLGALPLAVLQGRVGLGDVASLGQNERHRLLGGREDVRDGSVDDHDAEVRRLGDVHVVETNTGATNHDEVGTGLEGRRIDLRGRANDERVRANNGLQQRFWR